MALDSTPQQAGIPDGITRDDLEAAIRDLDAGTPHSFGPSTGYDLLYQGRRYPPKAVLGLAARRILGRELQPSEFSGGLDSKCFRLLASLGFTVEQKSRPVLPDAPSGRVWIEFANHPIHGGEGWGLGICLWSPTRASDGKDWYSTMRDAKPGDLVLHVLQGQFIGVSLVASSAHELADGPPDPGPWRGREAYYRVDLMDFSRFDAPLSMDRFLVDHFQEIRAEIDRGGLPKFYPFRKAGVSLEKGQGVYLAPCTLTLYHLLRDAIVPSVAPKRVDVVAQSSVRPGTTEGRVWAISLGEGGRLWNQSQERSEISIGWDYLGDLSRYKSQQEITDAIRNHENDGATPTNASLCCWQFANEINKGDTVIAKSGRDRVLGMGVVESDYLHDPSREEHHNVRRVRWTQVGAFTVPENAKVPIKTLTEVTEHTTFVTFVMESYRDEEPPPAVHTEPFGIEDALKDLFIPRSEFEAMRVALEVRKNVILCGPPGVGKTFVARRLAWSLLGAKDKSRVEMVQFHQSYSYEDFIQGIRPTTNGGFQVRNGVFYEFCNRARSDASRPYVFIIDEINRGNLSKILGELLMLIEADKRGSENAIQLTYSETGERCSVPDNLRLLGLMNTADRSLAMVDYALRRRFRFIELRPHFAEPTFRAFLESRGASPQLVTKIVDRMMALNTRIEADHKNLGRGFCIGHSFFCPPHGVSLDDAWYLSVVEGDIAPLLGEYWFEKRDTANKWIAELRAP